MRKNTAFQIRENIETSRRSNLEMTNENSRKEIILLILGRVAQIGS